MAGPRAPGQPPQDTCAPTQAMWGHRPAIRAQLGDPVIGVPALRGRQPPVHRGEPRVLGRLRQCLIERGGVELVLDEGQRVLRRRRHGIRLAQGRTVCTHPESLHMYRNYSSVPRSTTMPTLK